MPSYEFDVVIVGASSAGLYAADLLAREGKRVAVLEAQRELRPARRTLIVTKELRTYADNKDRAETSNHHTQEAF